jgi:hypothetical protein
MLVRSRRSSSLPDKIFVSSISLLAPFSAKDASQHVHVVMSGGKEELKTLSFAFEAYREHNERL